MEPLQLDCRWAWIALEHEQIVGLLLLAPVHGAVMLVRLVSGARAPVGWVKAVLTKASKDVLGRGYQIVYGYFNLDRPIEARLAKMMVNHGKKGRQSLLMARHALCACAVEDWA